MASQRFKRKNTLYRLQFEDPDLEGLEVLMKGLSFDRIESLIGLMGGLEDLQGAGDEIKPEQISVLKRFFQIVARGLHSWNLDDDDDQPVPATYEGVAAQELTFLMEIAAGWLQAVTQAPPPLPGASPNGATTPAASLSLASSSQSLPSSPAPG